MALSLRGGVAVSLLLAGLAIFFLAPVIPVQVQASIPDHPVSGYNCGFIINYTTTEFRSPSYQTAMSWLVFSLTGRSFDLGLVMFCAQIPALFLAPVAGVLVDRWYRHRILLATQSLAMLQAFALAALDLTGVVAVWHVLALS